MKRIITTCLLILSVIVLNAQEVYIYDKETEEPIDHVQVDIQGKRMASQYTDEKGFLVLQGVEKNDTLILTHITYVNRKIASNSLNAKNSIIYMRPESINYPSVMIYGAREKAVSTPQTVKVLSQEEINYQTPENAASLLESTGKVMIQRSQQGGGSPIIRGFEANRVLLVVDGVRMNNAIYRSGHLQNAITVDNNILEETEVIFGTSSLIYGSDALGGVVHYKTLDPKFSDELIFNAGASVKYASAAQENSAHAHFQIMAKKFSSLTSISYADFGDLKMGSERDHGDDDWGLVNEYYQNFSGIDSAITNLDPNIQRHSGYSQTDLLQKLKFKLSDKLNLIANGQFSTSSDIPRFDRYNDYSGGTLKFARWDYGPQNRWLFSMTADAKPGGKWADKANFTAAYQRIDEDRITRRFGSSETEVNEEDVTVLSFNGDMVKKFSETKRIFYGVEITTNDVQSSGRLVSNTLELPSTTRYPEGGSTLSSAAAYISFINTFHEKWNYNVGFRFNQVQASATFLDNGYTFDLPFSEIEFSNSAPTVSAGLKNTPNKNTELRLLTSTGFRSPNIDDFGKVFERDGYLVIPDNRISPEYALNGEIGVLQKFADQKVQLDINLFYTHIIDAIVRRDHQFNGQDSVIFSGDLVRVQSNQNTGEARIYGYSVGLKYDPTEKWGFNTTANYTVGDDLSNDVPLSHIPPFFLRGEVTFKMESFRSSFYVNYHDLKSRSLMGSGRTDNPNEGLDGQFPAWHTLNLRMQYNITKAVTAQVALENILDKHYKPFASGMSAAGRNFILSIRANIN